jgi:hypothetical protein
MGATTMSLLSAAERHSAGRIVLFGGATIVLLVFALSYVE